MTWATLLARARLHEETLFGRPLAFSGSENSTTVLTITGIRASLFGRRLERTNEELTVFDPDSNLSGSFPWNVDFGKQAHILFDPVTVTERKTMKGLSSRTIFLQIWIWKWNWQGRKTRRIFVFLVKGILLTRWKNGLG